MIRPSEWVVVGFLAYALVRLAFAPEIALEASSFPRADVLAAFLTVFTVRLALRYRDEPWAPELEDRRAIHRRLLFFLLGMGLFGLFVGQAAAPPHPTDGGKLAPILMVVHTWLFAGSTAIVLPLLLWLAYGMNVKRHGRLTLALFTETGAPLLHAVRDWAPPLTLIYFYRRMEPILARPLVPDQDALLERIDTALCFGRNPIVWMERLVSAPLSEWLAASYVAYAFLFPLVLGALYAKKDLAPFRQVAFATTLALAAGYILYTVVPAQGPLFTRKFDVSLVFYYMKRVKEELMDRTRIPRDCFPSLHTALSAIFLWGALKHLRPLGIVLLPIAVSIPFACMYLRYHYAVDVLAGLVLFGAVAFLSVRIARVTPTRASAAPSRRSV